MIEYDGIIWNGPDKKGYYKKRINGKQWYLHRYVYEKENGPLIKNMDIHHIDFNKENNDSSNLVQLTRTEHIKIHKIGIKFSDEHKNNISKGRTGIKFSDEHKNNISKGRIGKIVSNETRMKLSTAGKGRKHTIDTKKKMSESHQGKHDVKIRQIDSKNNCLITLIILKLLSIQLKMNKNCTCLLIH